MHNPILLTAICAVVSFFIGAIPFGLILGRVFNHTDIRKAGSGNIGTTNALRVAGPKVAALTLLLDWRIALVCWSLFAVLWLTTRYVSLGSVSAAAVFPVMTHLVFGDAFATAFSVLIAALVLFAHRENIKRLLNGTENKFRFHVNAPKSEGEA